MATRQILMKTQLRVNLGRKDKKGIKRIVEMRAMNNPMMIAAMSQVEKEARKRRKN